MESTASEMKVHNRMPHHRRTIDHPFARFNVCLALTFLLTFKAFVCPAQEAGVNYTLFLIGDCGEPVIKDSPIGDVLRREVEKAGIKSTVIYLGDNIYPFGLPAEGHKARSRGEEILRTQAGWISGLDAKGIFIPGNHDWQRWSRSGWEFVLNQQLFIDSLRNENIIMYPRDGCPGPVELQLSEDLVLLIIDSQWILHAYEKPGEESDCMAKDPNTLLVLLQDAFERNHGKRIVLAAHHPVISYGDHGGVFTLQDHLFPLVDLHPALYVPMPVVGSIYPLYRSLLGHPQDIKHVNYNQYSKAIQRLLAQYPGSLYVAGHEHALQHIVKDSAHHIVSGSGSKTGHVRKGRYAQYAKGVKGFVKVIFTTDGSAHLEYWQVDDDFTTGKVVHTAELAPVRQLLSSPDAVKLLEQDTVAVSASHQYAAGPGRRFFFGSNYRDTWQTQVKVPVFQLSNQGLKILQKGGGQQTLSLRLADSTGREYVLRSVEKNPEGAVPEMFRKTFAQDLVQDQISASHPYGALVIPELADKAGIYHTNPKLVYIADDSLLGKYRRDFAGTLAIFEERPDEDWSDKAFFGNSSNIISTSKVLEKLADDTDNRVDQRFVARSRLFDLWIGDWDRHDDQWRWATQERGKLEIFRPIPRDRDQAFFVNEGILPKVWSRRWALPKFEGFDNDINWIPGVAFNARHFDRTFLNELEESVWIEEAEALKNELTDDVIEAAIGQWPEEVYKLDGPEIISKLKARREKLTHYAQFMNRYLSREVSVVGSNKTERFLIHRLESGDVTVEGFKINKKGEQSRSFYSRTLRQSETKEIQIYGLHGDDQFIVTGNASKSILVRIIGGPGRDSVNDNSTVASFRRKTLYYDNRDTDVVVGGKELQDKTSNQPDVNLYDRKSYQPDRLAPLLYGQFNPDDGLFFGGGFLYQTEGFRKDPFKARHIFLASVAPRTNSYNILYRGDFTDVIGKWGLSIDADIKSPNYVNNFFGLGNETVFNKDIDEDQFVNVDDAIDYYRFRFREVRLDVALRRKLFGSAELSIGPAYQHLNVEDPGESDRFVKEYASGLDYQLFGEENDFAGLVIRFEADQRNDPKFTSRGTYITLEGRSMNGLDRLAYDFHAYEAAVALYHSLIPSGKLVFAGRIGGGRTFGHAEFYQAQILSGRTDLRGFRKTRFYGDSKMYANLEMRAKLFSVKTYLFPASVGILAFHDLGRVWYKDETGIDPSAGGSSNKWHKGWGGGIWFTPFNLTVLSVEAGHSEEGTLGYVRLGFLF